MALPPAIGPTAAGPRAAGPRAGAGRRFALLSRRYANVALAALVVSMVGMMIVPLPTALLDVLLAANLAVALLVLLVALTIRGGLELASFPTILLVTTLYRLALNISSTRLILLQADAGEVIRAFGAFVVSGNYVVGAVVFLIITLVQFVVIARGSERVAEVGARFTLDAMPGRQMAIDAELRSGVLDVHGATEQRTLLRRESEFFGAMDGAMKFVKGDAIAGLVITVVNILGGLAIGIGMHGMGATEALETYGLLTIGDGLVSQIPALLLATAAGLVVTRVSSEDGRGSLASDLGRQIFGRPRVLLVAAGFLALLAVVPGLPTLPFLALALVLGVFGAHLLRTGVSDTDDAAHAEGLRPGGEALAVTVGAGLGKRLPATFVDDQVQHVRERLFQRLGVVLPPVRVRTDEALAPDAYVILVREVPAARAEVVAGLVHAACSPERALELGVTVTERGGNAWVSRGDEARLSAAHIAVYDEATHLERALEDAGTTRASELVGMQQVQDLLDQLGRTHPAVVRAVVPRRLDLATLVGLTRRLVQEGVSIRPLETILEAVAASDTSDPARLVETVRRALARPITHSCSGGQTLEVHTLDPMVEELLADSIEESRGHRYLALSPDLLEDLLRAVRKHAARILVVRADLRPLVFDLVAQERPRVVVLSYDELDPEVDVKTVARIEP